MSVHKQYSTTQEIENELKANNGSDRKPPLDKNIKPYKHPGEEELTASLDSVVKNWREKLNVSELYMLIPTGKPPQQITKEDLTEFRKEAENANAQMSPFSRLPANARKLLPVGSFDKMQKQQAAIVDSVVPGVWLAKEMRKLCAIEPFISQVGFSLGQQAFASFGKTNQLWIRAVAVRNGLIKTIKELLDYTDPKTGEILPDVSDDDDDEQEEEEQEEEKPKEDEQKAKNPTENLKKRAAENEIMPEESAKRVKELIVVE